MTDVDEVIDMESGQESASPPVESGDVMRTASSSSPEPDPLTPTSRALALARIPHPLAVTEYATSSTASRSARVAIGRSPRTRSDEEARSGHVSLLVSPASSPRASHDRRATLQAPVLTLTTDTRQSRAASYAAVASPMALPTMHSASPPSLGNLLDPRPSQLRVLSPDPPTGNTTSPSLHAVASARPSGARHTASHTLFATPSSLSSTLQLNLQRAIQNRRSSLGPLTTAHAQTTTPSATQASSTRASMSSALARMPSSSGRSTAVASAQSSASPSPPIPASASASPSPSPLPPPPMPCASIESPSSRFNPAFGVPTAHHHARLASLMLGMSGDFAFALDASMLPDERHFGAAGQEGDSGGVHGHRGIYGDDDHLALSLDDVRDIDLGAHEAEARALARLRLEEASHQERLEYVFIHLFFLVLVAHLDVGALPAVAVRLRVDVPELGYAGIGLLCTLHLIGLLLGGLVSGPLLERASSQVRVLTVGLVVHGLGLVLLGGVVTPTSMLLARLLSGIAQAPFVVFLPAWVERHAPTMALRDTWTTWLHASSPLGVGLGFMLGVICCVQSSAGDDADDAEDDHLAWRWAFLLPGLLLVPLALALLLLPRHLASTRVGEEEAEKRDDTTRKAAAKEEADTTEPLPPTTSTEALARARTAARRAYQRALKWQRQKLQGEKVEEQQKGLHGFTQHDFPYDSSPTPPFRHATTPISSPTRTSHLAIHVSASPPGVERDSASRMLPKWSPLAVATTPLASSSPNATSNNSTTNAATLKVPTSVTSTSVTTTTTGPGSGRVRRFSHSNPSQLAAMAHSASTTTLSLPSPAPGARADSDGVALVPGTTSMTMPTPSPMVSAAEPVEVDGSPSRPFSSRLYSLVGGDTSATGSPTSPLASAAEVDDASAHAAAPPLFDTLDLASMFSPRHRVVTWTWRPQGRRHPEPRPYSDETRNARTWPSSSRVDDHRHRDDGEEDALPSSSQLLRALASQFRAHLSNRLYVALVLAHAALFFLLASFHYWLATYALVAFTDARLSVVGLAYVLLVLGAPPIGVALGRKAMQRIEARLDARYDRELLATNGATTTVVSGASTFAYLVRQVSHLLGVGSTSERSGPMFDTVGRKSRQLTKQVCVLVFAALTPTIALACLLVGVAPSDDNTSGGLALAFIAVGVVLVAGGASVACLSWLLDGAVWGATSTGDGDDTAATPAEEHVASALALAQLAYNLFGYALAPVVIGAAMDSGGVVVGFRLALGWSLVLVAVVLVAAALQWRECAHQRNIEDIQRAVQQSIATPTTTMMTITKDTPQRKKPHHHAHDDALEHDNDNPALSPRTMRRHASETFAPSSSTFSSSSTAAAAGSTLSHSHSHSRTSSSVRPSLDSPESRSRRGSVIAYDADEYGDEGIALASEPPSPPHARRALAYAHANLAYRAPDPDADSPLPAHDADAEEIDEDDAYMLYGRAMQDD